MLNNNCYLLCYLLCYYLFCTYLSMWLCPETYVWQRTLTMLNMASFSEITMNCECGKWLLMMHPVLRLWHVRCCVDFIEDIKWRLLGVW